jgi:hypothetical protein
LSAALRVKVLSEEYGLRHSRVLFYRPMPYGCNQKMGFPRTFKVRQIEILHGATEKADLLRELLQPLRDSG